MEETEDNVSVVFICQSKNKCILPYTEHGECPSLVPADRLVHFRPISLIIVPLNYNCTYVELPQAYPVD